MARVIELLTAPERSEIRNFARGATLSANVEPKRLSEIYREARASETGRVDGDDSLVVVLPSMSHVDLINRGAAVILQLLEQITEHERFATAHVSHTRQFGELVEERDELRARAVEAERARAAAEAHRDELKEGLTAKQEELDGVSVELKAIAMAATTE